MTDIEQALAAVEAIENLTDRQAIYNEAGKLRQHLQAIARQAAIGAAVLELLNEPHHLGYPVSARTWRYDRDTPMVKRDWHDRLMALRTAALGEDDE